MSSIHLTSQLALELTNRIIGTGVLLETLEIWSFRDSTSDTGIWSWGVVKREFEIFPKLIQRLFDFFLSSQNFKYLLIARMTFAVLFLFAPGALFAALLFLTTTLICLRWRGTIHGGSDFMTLIVLGALTVAFGFGPETLAAKGCLLYIALQSCTSYFIAGVIKVKRKNWRQGHALAGFMRTTIYETTPIEQLFSSQKWLAWGASWVVMSFECLFPAVFFGPRFALLFLCTALLFHLANTYVFGLNRFLFAWAATYPAIYYSSTLVSNRW